MNKNQTLLDTLLELQILDRVPRSGYALRGVPDPESVTEHSWHVVFLVWALGAQIPEVDTARAVEIALLHDLAEVRFGDLPRTASRYLPEGAKAIAEERAMEDLLAGVPHGSVDLWRDYDAGKSPEARLVKACDKLQLMIKVSVYEQWGAGGLGEFWENPDNFPDGGFEPIRQLFEELRSRRRSRLDSAPGQ